MPTRKLLRVLAWMALVAVHACGGGQEPPEGARPDV